MTDLTFDGVTVNAPRSLSDNETKMMDRSVQALKRLHPGLGGKALAFTASAAMDAILCNDGFWSEMAQNARVRVSKAGEDGNRRNAALLAYEGMVIGMVEVMDVRYGIHDGRRIADAIDDATRPREFDMLRGFVSKHDAYDIISRAYGSSASADASA